MKILYERLNKKGLVDSNRLYQCGMRELSRLEPRRPDPFDQCQLIQSQEPITSSTIIQSDYHSSANQSYHENGEKSSTQGCDKNVSNDDEQTGQYLQVDPRCYVRQNSTISATKYRKGETARLEKGYSLNVDTRPSSAASSLSPYRQSSFDVELSPRSPNNQSSIPSPALSTQQEIYYTPRGSSLSVVGNTQIDYQHLSPVACSGLRKNSSFEKKDLSITIDSSDGPSTVHSSVVQQDSEHFHSFDANSPATNSSVDKQSRSFDAVHLLRPVTQRTDFVVNRRTKSYEYADENQVSIAPAPIVIKIPDMSQLVQAAQLSQLQNEFKQDLSRKTKLISQTLIGNTNNNNGKNSMKDFRRLRKSHEVEEEQQTNRISPDLLTSTSCESTEPLDAHCIKNTNDNDENLSNYEYRRKSSTNLLSPPAEVRRQALRRTFEKRRNQMNKLSIKQEESNNNNNGEMKADDFTMLLNNLNCKSENSSFDRSLDTDFDVQSDASSREPNDQFTSIDSSGNENFLPDLNQRLVANEKQTRQNQDDSAYKSLESQFSQTRTISLDWASVDSGEKNANLSKSHFNGHKSFDSHNLESDLNDHSEKMLCNYRFSSTNIIDERQSSANNIMNIQGTLGSTNSIFSSNKNILINKVLPSTSMNRTASKKRREFSKDKRQTPSTNVLPYVTNKDEHQLSSTNVYQISEINSKVTLNKIQTWVDVSGNELLPLSADMKRKTNFSSRAISFQETCSAMFDQLSSSTKPTNPKIESFRSKRSSISLDNQNPLKDHFDIQTNKFKPRLKFSIVRDSTTSNKSNSSLPSNNDFSIDDKTNQLINEYLMNDGVKTFDNERSPSKRHQHNRIRPQTFDETVLVHKDNPQKQCRMILVRKSQNNSLETSLYSDEETVIQQVDNTPSIIVTGYDS